MRNSLPKVLITGGRGQLANALLYHPHAFAFYLIVMSRDELDITEPESIKLALETHNPDFVINTAAYTAVDKAESDEDQALLVNHIGARNVADACAERNIILVHLSTDYVFDGAAPIPYTEESATAPINIYGQSKLLGEQAVRESCEKHIILRVSGVFSEYGTNFVKSIVRQSHEKAELSVVADQITCPTYAGDIAEAIYKILATEDRIYSTYHFCSKDPVSWHQFAVSIIAEAETFAPIKTQKVLPISAVDYPTAAKRPAYSVLNCDKIRFTYGIEQPGTQKALQTILSLIPEKTHA